MENLRSIDAVGLLTRVLVKQIHEVCKLEVESLNYTELKRETEHFYQFIHKIANRKEYERVPLKFNRTYIRVKVFLVTSTIKASEGGKGIYDRIKEAKAFDHIYLICPAINRNMVDKKTVPSWKVYNEVLTILKRNSGRFHISKTQKYQVKGKNGQNVEVGISLITKML